MNEKYNAPNSNCCGRPMSYAPQSKCNCDWEPCVECNKQAIGCIKKGFDPCKTCCVLPSTTIEKTDGLTNFANCLVHVTSINTTFYIDDKHSPLIIWSGAVEIDNYDIADNPLNLRAQDCYTTVNGEYALVRFDKQGVGHIISTEEEQNGM